MPLLFPALHLILARMGGEVRVGARPEGAEIVLWVADHGLGIPPESIPQLFSKFFRVDNQETRSIGGTGLGLALVKEIIEAHEGRVWVESSLGQGSTFFFTVPVTEPALLAMPAPEIETGRAAEIVLVEDDQAYAQLLCTHLTGAGFAVTTTRSAEQALAGADYLLKPVSAAGLREAIRHRLPVRAGTRVLVVDDDASFRRHVIASLAPERDIQVEEAATGQEVLACLAEHLPDLVLLDLLMPELDGFAVLRRLRADKRAMNLPVVVMTGKNLLPREKAFLQRRLASLMSKEEASLDYFTQVVTQISTSVRSTPAQAVSLHEADTIVLS